jgi:hypothetical protein
MLSTIFAMGQAYELKLSEGYSVEPYREYVFKKDNNMKESPMSTRKQNVSRKRR